MTWRLARPAVIAIIEAISDVYDKTFGYQYTYNDKLDPRVPGNVPGASRDFCVFLGPMETDSGSYVAGLERTRCDVRLSVWLQYTPNEPAAFDVVMGEVYQEIRGPLLRQGNWDQPSSTLVQIEGPDGINVVGNPEFVADETTGAILGAWLHFDLSVTHEEQGS